MVVWVFTFILLPHPKEFGVGNVIPGKLLTLKAALKVIAEVLDMLTVGGVAPAKPDTLRLLMRG